MIYNHQNIEYSNFILYYYLTEFNVILKEFNLNFIELK